MSATTPGQALGMRRVVVVTGGTSGVGRAVARAFAGRGDVVAVLARGEDALRATEAELRAAGVPALAVQCDVSESGQVEAAADRVEQELGPIAVWVNNAMTSVFAPFLDNTAEEFDRVTRVTYLGSVNGTRAALRRMVPRDHGTIVQVGSALAFRGIPLQSAYCGAKHGIEGFLDSVRAELLHDHSKVWVSSVHLPAVNTPQFGSVRNKMGAHGQPVPPIYQPELPAAAVVWAAGHRRREVWLGAPTVGTILGNRVSPRLLDHYLGRTGYDSQLDHTLPAPTPGRDYLFQPLPGDPGAHGRFDDRATSRSASWFMSRHRPVLTALLGGAILAGSGVVRRRLS